mgnify:CR=1 FL=1
MTTDKLSCADAFDAFVAYAIASDRIDAVTRLVLDEIVSEARALLKEQLHEKMPGVVANYMYRVVLTLVNSSADLVECKARSRRGPARYTQTETVKSLVAAWHASMTH